MLRESFIKAISLPLPKPCILKCRASPILKYDYRFEKDSS